MFRTTSLLAAQLKGNHMPLQDDLPVFKQALREVEEYFFLHYGYRRPIRVYYGVAL